MVLGFKKEDGSVTWASKRARNIWIGALAAVFGLGLLLPPVEDATVEAEASAAVTPSVAADAPAPSTAPAPLPEDKVDEEYDYGPHPTGDDAMWREVADGDDMRGFMMQPANVRSAILRGEVLRLVGDVTDEEVHRVARSMFICMNHSVAGADRSRFEEPWKLFHDMCLQGVATALGR